MLNTNVYLSSDVPRWAPQTEQDLQDAIARDLLEETYFVDIKREVEVGKAANRELARDLASFAIDGGTIIVGVAEDKTTGTVRLDPQLLKGLSERVEQIARTIPDPALAIVITAIPTSVDPTLGYLLIQVPSSSVAPHMVDGKYVGDKTKIYLSDAEVSRLHHLRQTNMVSGLALLRHEIEKDPIANGEQAHLFLVAEPLRGKEGMLRVLTEDADATTLYRFRDFALTRELNELLKARAIAPALMDANHIIRRTNGVGLFSYAPQLDGRVQRNNELAEDVVELKINEDGGLRMFLGRLSVQRSSAGPQQIFDRQAVTFTRQLLALATAAAHLSGYLGEWTFAVGATGLKGKHSFALDGFYHETPLYDEEEYARSTTTSYIELEKQPGLIADRLVGRFLRALGTYKVYSDALSDGIDSPS